MRPPVIAILYIALIAVGCETNYGPSANGGTGYFDQQVSDGAYQVRFSGNQSTTREKADDFTLLRCAELALEEGFPYFRVDQFSDQTQIASSVVDKTQTGSPGFSGNEYGATTAPESENFRIGRTAPAMTYSIRLLEAAPVEPVDWIAFDANLVRDQLRRKYGLPSGERE
jgi:hypothetical protein